MDKRVVAVIPAGALFLFLAAQRGNVSDDQLNLHDITTNNVSTSKHGFAPKAPNDVTKYLDGTGAYSVPPGTGGGGGCTATKYTITQSAFGSTWTVTGQSGQAVTAATTQTINIVTLASKVVMQGLRWKPTTAWAGTSLTNYQVSIGTSASGGTTASYMPLLVSGGTGNNCTGNSVPFAVSDSPFGDCPGYFDEGGMISSADNGETVTLTAKSTGGNLTATTAGSWDLTLCTITLP
jgi:hypothetical protein